MDNARLYDRLWPHRLDHVGQPFQTVTDHEERIAHAAVLQVDQHAHPKFGALAADAGPQPQHVLAAVHGDPDGRVDGPVRDLAIPHLHHDSVDEHGDVDG